MYVVKLLVDQSLYWQLQSYIVEAITLSLIFCLVYLRSPHGAKVAYQNLARWPSLLTLSRFIPISSPHPLDIIRLTIIYWPNCSLKCKKALIGSTCPDNPKPFIWTNRFRQSHLTISNSNESQPWKTNNRWEYKKYFQA